MANPYYVRQAGDLTQGLSGLSGVISKIGEQKKAEEFANNQQLLNEQAAIKKQMLNEEAAMVMQNGTPDEKRSFLYKNPDMAEGIKKIFEMKFPGESKNKYTNLLFSAGIDLTLAPQLLDEMKVQFEQDGVLDPSEIARLDSLRKAITENDTESATKIIDGELALLADKETWDKYKDLKKKPKDIDPYEGLESGYETYLRANKLPNNKTNYEKYKKADIENKKLLKKDGAKWPNLADLMAQGWMPSGRITGPQMDAFESAAVRAQERGEPLTPEKLRDMEFQAVKNRSTGSAAGSRIVLQRKQNIEAASGLLKDMKVVSDKLNYSPVKFIGALEKWKKGQLNDPLFTEYMTQRADSLFILGNALKQNGLTDKSIEVEEEAFNPSLAPKAFDAWLNVQVRALNRAAEEMNRDFKYGISQSAVYPAGQGGAPTNENPEPSLPIKDKPIVLNFDSQGNLIK